MNHIQKQFLYIIGITFAGIIVALIYMWPW